MLEAPKSNFHCHIEAYLSQILKCQSLVTRVLFPDTPLCSYWSFPIPWLDRKLLSNGQFTENKVLFCRFSDSECICSAHCKPEQHNMKREANLLSWTMNCRVICHLSSSERIPLSQYDSYNSLSSCFFCNVSVFSVSCLPVVKLKKK